MKLLTLTALTLALTAPVSHAETSRTETLRLLEQARAATLEAQARSDTAIIKAICVQTPTVECLRTMRKTINAYKLNVIEVHKMEEEYRKNNGWKTVPSDKTLVGRFP